MAKKKKRLLNNEKFIGLVLGSIFITIIISVLITTYNEKVDLSKNSRSTVGRVEKVYRIKSRGHFINYSYKVNGVSFKGSQPISNKLILDTIKVGDRFNVEYSSQKHKNSKLILETNIKKTSGNKS